MSLADVALLLGPVAFQGFEIPQDIGFGGEQRLAVHDLPGGDRIIDAMGPAPADITWSGIFSGPDATLRARTLDVLRMQGAVLTLSWDVFFYTVVISRFDAGYQSAGWVPYRLSVRVLTDPAQVVVGLVDTLLTDAIGDTASAFGYAALAGTDLGALQTAVAVTGAIVLQTGAYVAADAALASAQSSVQAGRNSADAFLAGSARTPDSADDVTSMIGQAGNAAALSAAAAYLGRVGTNIRNASS